MSNKNKINIINLASFLFLLYASYLFRKNGNMLNSSSIKTYFMPAPYAFSIWILIYICLFVWIVKGFFATPREDIMYKDVGLWFFINMTLAGLSVLVPVKLSPFFIIGALISSLIVYIIVNSSNVNKNFKIPFSLLCGWISIATITNISLVLKMNGFTSFLFISEVGFALIMLTISTLIALTFTITFDDIIFPSVFIWAYVAIMIQNPATIIILRTALLYCIILLGTIFYVTYNQLNENKQKTRHT
ncbi:hypothetical protein [Terrisporobacter sp.]